MSWSEVSALLERVGLKTYQRGTIHYLSIRGKLVGLFCQVTDEEGEAKRVDETFNRIKPLCNLILNSLVLQQAY